MHKGLPYIVLNVEKFKCLGHSCKWCQISPWRKQGHSRLPAQPEISYKRVAAGTIGTWAKMSQQPFLFSSHPPYQFLHSSLFSDNAGYVFQKMWRSRNVFGDGMMGFKQILAKGACNKRQSWISKSTFKHCPGEAKTQVLLRQQSSPALRHLSGANQAKINETTVLQTYSRNKLPRPAFGTQTTSSLLIQSPLQLRGITQRP